MSCLAATTQKPPNGAANRHSNEQKHGDPICFKQNWAKRTEKMTIKAEATNIKSNLQSKPAVANFKSLGPVPDLEEHVQPDWWRRIFNSTYLKTDGDVIDDAEITTKEVDLFSDILKFSQQEKILDLCCGQGCIALELARRGFSNVEGLDRSRYLIQKAKAQSKKEKLSVKFREGDARKLPYQPDTFDVVMIPGNSFGYFETPQDDVRVLKEVFRVLKPWGKILIDVADGEFIRRRFKPRSWEWIDKNYFVCRERSQSKDKHRLISREVVTHVKKGVVADQFYAERLYTRKNLDELFATAGFKDITVHSEISVDSKRNQDLGMMERRITLTATARKDWTPQKKTKELTHNLVVILGDPAKPDPLKPLCVFDDDDFYTIDQMKNALRLPEDLPKLCGYEAKWMPDSPYWKLKSIPANLPEDTEKVLVESSLKLFERLDCRDYSRLDWRLDSNGTPKLLEVNPNPGWCWDGHLAKMAKMIGMSYSEMLGAILSAAEERLGIKLAAS
jgi:ubiquinone/menaquinone biosynthesis C-methylase UbiE